MDNKRKSKQKSFKMANNPGASMSTFNKNMGASVAESYDPSSRIPIDYNDLDIEFYYGAPRGADYGKYYHETKSYTYWADASEVFDLLCDYYYDDCVAEISEGDLESYVNEHFDELLDQYYIRVQDYFKRRATDECADDIDPEERPDPFDDIDYYEYNGYDEPDLDDMRYETDDELNERMQMRSIRADMNRDRYLKENWYEYDFDDNMQTFVDRYSFKDRSSDGYEASELGASIKDGLDLIINCELTYLKVSCYFDEDRQSYITYVIDNSDDLEPGERPLPIEIISKDFFNNWPDFSKTDKQILVVALQEELHYLNTELLPDFASRYGFRLYKKHVQELPDDYRHLWDYYESIKQIDIRESLYDLDVNSDECYDLVNLYDAYVESIDVKKHIAHMINENRSAKQIHDYIIESLGNYSKVEDEFSSNRLVRRARKGK